MYSHDATTHPGLGDVKPRGGQCYEAWFQPITHHRPPGWAPQHQIDGEDDERYRVVGVIQDQEAVLNRQLYWQTIPQGTGWILVAVRELKHRTVEGDIQRTSWDPDPAGAALMNLLASGFQQSGKPFTVCGPTFQFDGWPYVVVNSWDQGPDPAATAAPIIEVTGELSTWSPPGVSQVWPKVGPLVVSSSLNEQRSGEFNSAWNENEIRPGDVLYIRGPEDYVRGSRGIIPADWRVLERGGGPPVDDPGKVDLPETPDDLPGPVDPDATWPPPDDDLDDGIEPDDLDDGTEPDDLDDGTGPGDGTGPDDLDDGTGPQVGTDGEPSNNGDQTPVTAGFKMAPLALASFLFFFLPGFIGRGKGEWEVGQGSKPSKSVKLPQIGDGAAFF